MSATKSLILCIGLVLVIGIGVRLQQGSAAAGGDAHRALAGGLAGGLVSGLAGPAGLRRWQRAGEIGTPGALPLPAPLQAAPPATLPGTLPMYEPDPVSPFGCFHACGPSCTCAGKKESQQTVPIGGRSCTYHVIECRTHPFCVWHDQCYLDCDKEASFAIGRSLCYRDCDSSCLTGISNHSDYPDPPGSYSLAQCIRWARATDSAPYTGTLTYSELQGCQGGS